MPQKVLFGRWLRARRTALDLTQWDLAERIGCSRDVIQKIESGTRRPSKQIAELLVGSLDLPLQERPAFVRWARLGPNATPPDSALASLSHISPIPAQPDELLPPFIFPTPLTSLIGRDEEVADIRRYLLRDGIRLITLIGPPGIGKTRLSLAVAARLTGSFRDGVYFVPLETVRDPNGVLPAIAQVVRVKPLADEPIGEAIARHLHAQRVLLLLDNFEQVLDAGPQLLQLLSACPALKALATSREPLHVYGEWRFRVPALELPKRKRLPELDLLAGVASVALFMQRAQALKPDLALTSENASIISSICLRLDGLPLAIELAAAQIEDLTPQEILAGLGNRLKLLRGDLRYLPPRQQTLRGAIDWSYHLLTVGEQTLLRRLGVFVGGWSREAVRAVCYASHDLDFEAPEGLAALVNKSLTYRGAGVDDEARWWMLESIREYARERLEASDEAPEIHRRHAWYCVQLAEAAHPHLAGPDQVKWLARLEQEHDNIRSALAWSIDRRHDSTEIALRLCAAQAKFWYMRGHARVGRQWLQAALELPVPSRGGESATSEPEASRYSILRAKVLRASGALAFVQGDYQTGRSDNQAALLLAQQAGDRACSAACLANLGGIAGYVGDYAQARALLAEGLALLRELGDKPGIILTLGNLGHAAMVQGDNASARSSLLESVALGREVGDKYSTSYALVDLAEIAIEEQAYEDADKLLQESLSIHREIADEVGAGKCLVQFGNLARARCNYQKAGELYREGLVLSRKVGDGAGIIDALQQQAELYVCLGQVSKAVCLWSAAETISRAIGTPARPQYRPRYEQSLARARADLGEEAFEHAWAEGMAMNLDQAVEAALSDSRSTLPPVALHQVY